MEQNSQTRLYFAYGSNLNLEKMRTKCSDPRVVGIARLRGYRIGFYGHSVVWDGAVETLVPENGVEVWGVLYQLDAADWERLDRCEDARADGNGEYFHYPIKVVDEQQRVREASMYKKDKLGQPMLPSTEYLALIVQGAKEQGLPETYIATLQKIRTKPASYKVPRRPSFIRGRFGGCSGCED